MTPLRALVLDCQKLLKCDRDAIPWLESLDKIADLLDSDRARDALAADEAAGWQPAHTAPKDGRNLLAGWWSSGKWVWVECQWESGVFRHTGGAILKFEMWADAPAAPVQP